MDEARDVPCGFPKDTCFCREDMRSSFKTRTSLAEQFLAFVGQSDGNSRLWLRSLDQVMARVLAGTEGAAQPFWSPDSRSIGFFAGGRLKRVEIAGGMPRTLADAAPGFGGAWSADGVILFAATSTTPLLRVSANGGEPIAQTRLDPPRQGGHGFPTFLPGGREFLFFARGTDEGQGVYLASLDAPDTTRLIVADRPPVAHVSLAQNGWLSGRATRQLDGAAIGAHEEDG